MSGLPVGPAAQNRICAAVAGWGMVLVFMAIASIRFMQRIELTHRADAVSMHLEC